MDAERALRIQRVEVPRIKALAVREGPILFAEGKGKPYVFDPVAVKVLPFPSLRPLFGAIFRHGWGSRAGLASESQQRPRL